MKGILAYMVLGMVLICYASPANAAEVPSRQPSREEAQARLNELRKANLEAQKTFSNPPALITPDTKSPGSVTQPEELVTSVKIDRPAAKPSPMPKGTLPEEIGRFQEAVTGGKKQIIKPDKREFAKLSRNYQNRIDCAGEIEKLIIPQDQGIEAEIAPSRHHLFLRVGMNPAQQFPLDFSIICDGSVYLVNAVVTPHFASEILELELPKGVRPLSATAREKHKDSISAAEALPLEEKLTKIMQRIYTGDHLSYWREVETPTTQSRWTYASYAVLLQKVVKVEIDGLIAWDFVFRGRFPTSSFYDVIRKIVAGEVIAFGKVTYEGQNAARVVVITREDRTGV